MPDTFPARHPATDDLGLRSGDEVRTPTGRAAVIGAVDEKRGEATVEWPAERAAFRLVNLRRKP